MKKEANNTRLELSPDCQSDRSFLQITSLEFFDRRVFSSQTGTVLPAHGREVHLPPP